MDWKDYSFIVRSKERKRVFKALVTPKTPSELAVMLKKKVPQISRTLKEFSERGLVECKTPNQKVGRVYALTKKGENVLEGFKEKNA